MLQTSVEIVKPGGTGRPALVISASPAPLPPSVSRIVRSPSALPLPKKNTCFLARAAGFFAGAAALAVPFFTGAATLPAPFFATRATVATRSEERRVGKEGRSR